MADCSNCEYVRSFVDDTEDNEDIPAQCPFTKCVKEEAQEIFDKAAEYG